MDERFTGRFPGSGVGRNRRQPYCAGCAGYRRNTLSLLRPTGPTPHHAANPREARMQDRPEKTAPRTLRLNAHDNLIVAIDPVASGTSVQGVAATQRIMRGHKMAVAADRQGRAVLKFGQIIGFASEDIAPGDQVHDAQLLVMRRVRARLCLRAGRARRGAPAARGARHLRGLPPRQRQGRHAQLYRHPDQRELLGHGRRASSPRPSTAPASSTTIPISTASSRSCTAPAAASTGKGEGYDDRSSARSGAMPANPNIAGVLMVGPRLRGVPDRRLKRSLRPRSRATPSAP